MKSNLEMFELVFWKGIPLVLTWSCFLVFWTTVFNLLWGGSFEIQFLHYFSVIFKKRFIRESFAPWYSVPSNDNIFFLFIIGWEGPDSLLWHRDWSWITCWNCWIFLWGKICIRFSHAWVPPVMHDFCKNPIYARPQNPSPANSGPSPANSGPSPANSGPGIFES